MSAQIDDAGKVPEESLPPVPGHVERRAVPD
jgi:hypothetical protein